MGGMSGSIRGVKLKRGRFFLHNVLVSVVQRDERGTLQYSLNIIIIQRSYFLFSNKSYFFGHRVHSVKINLKDMHRSIGVCIVTSCLEGSRAVNSDIEFVQPFVIHNHKIKAV